MNSEISDFQGVFFEQKTHALTLRTSNAADRRKKLERVKEWLVDNRITLQQALSNDFKKPPSETDLTEFYLVKAELDLAIKHLTHWMEQKRVPTPITLIGSKSSVVFEPKGVCLIIGPWNYPFSLIIGPMVSAIAAGNTCMLKPSEMTPNTSALILKMCNEIFESNEVAVFEGGKEVSTRLLELPFDHIFFTGSTTVGKIVMKAASDHLTSVTLELGGKTPNILDETANLKDAVEKIVFNKFLNGGQTCIAPDYIFIHESCHKEFIKLLTLQIKSVYENNQADLAGIINEKHINHLKTLIDEAIAKGAKLELGGEPDVENLRLEPTVITQVNGDMRILKDEIFGPILPVLTFTSLDEVLNFVNQRDKPLALYFYSQSRANISKVINQTSSGGICINDGNVHFSNNHLPFGGVNASGMGKAHGYHSFKAFSNEKAILKQRIGLTSLKFLYPPYSKRVKKIIDLLLKWF